MIYTYQHNGATHTVNLERLPDGRYSAKIGEATHIFSAQRVQDGWVLMMDGQRTLVHSAAQGNERYLSVGRYTYTLTVPDTQKARRKATSTTSGTAELRAQMPGQVVEVLITAGDSVQKGQTLVILEAMKMEIRVAAPNDGTLQRLLVAKGDTVERGQLLAEIGE